MKVRSAKQCCSKRGDRLSSQWALFFHGSRCSGALPGDPCPAEASHPATYPLSAPLYPEIPAVRLSWGSAQQPHICTAAGAPGGTGLIPEPPLSAPSPAAASLQSIPGGCRGRVGSPRHLDSHHLRGRAPALGRVKRGLTSKCWSS